MVGDLKAPAAAATKQKQQFKQILKSSKNNRKRTRRTNSTLKAGAPKGGEARRVGRPNISRFLFFSHTHFHFFFSLWGSSRVCLPLSLGVFSWNFGGVLVGRDLQCAVARRLSCGSPWRPCVVRSLRYSANRRRLRTRTEVASQLSRIKGRCCCLFG